MIVRDAGNAWQIVLQPDHADLSGQFAQAWGGDGFARPNPAESVVIAATRHDDGWAVWERAPSLEPGTSRPRTFLDVQVPSHLAFYRACIVAVTDQDAYAGLLISMHGAGIYRGRYGTQPGLSLRHADEVKEQVNTFVEEQEAEHPGLVARLGVAETERWVNYRLLQIFDRLSLYFCLKDLENGEADSIEPVPVDYEGREVAVALGPVGPWRVRLDPYPFARSPAEFTLVRHVLAKREWADDESFRRDFFAHPPETTRITVERR